ncbi:MAG TPA: hypothetical protein VF177_03755 [Anaerolineae bacterium]
MRFSENRCAIPHFIIAAAFLLLDFRLLRAQMAVDSNAGTYSFSIDEERRLPLEQDLDLYVQAPQGLEAQVVEALSEELPTNPYVRAVNVQEEPLAAAVDSVVVVEIDEPSVLFWSPFYARTVMTVDVAYASDGEVAWIDEDVVVLESSDPPVPVVRVRAEHSFNGSAYGLISRPGYASYLANELATHINASLANTLADRGGRP